MCFLKERIPKERECGPDSSSSEYGPVADSCEHFNELSDGEFLD
jgi:hypothetical protein